VLKTGILNPLINSLLGRVRHTNTLVIADRGFPFWPQIEIVDISLIDNIPTVLNVLEAVRSNFQTGRSFMAEEFRSHNSGETVARFESALSETVLLYEPHEVFKRRVPGAIGLIRTADTIQYANIILESA
jgi:D-ribose pyranase